MLFNDFVPPPGLAKILEDSMRDDYIKTLEEISVLINNLTNRHSDDPCFNKRARDYAISFVWSLLKNFNITQDDINDYEKDEHERTAERLQKLEKCLQETIDKSKLLIQEKKE